MQTGGMVMMGRAARLVLLVCTLFGLAALHTIGHGGVTHVARVDGQQIAITDHAILIAYAPTGGSEDCAGDGCAHTMASPGDTRYGTSRWDVCVAVLSALTIAVLLGVLFLIAAAGRIPRRFGGRNRAAPWTAPRLSFGLTLATVSQLRT